MRLQERTSCGLWFVSLVMMVVCGLCVNRAQAQAAATISGTVSDSTGAVVSGAQVTIRNTDTNVEHHTATDKSGHYAVPNISPGVYTISCAKTGFAISQETGVTLTVGLAAVFNFRLSPGAVNQEVTVQSEATQLQQSSSALGNVIQKETVLSMPLAARNFTNLLVLTPGISNVDVAQTGAFNAIGTATLPSVNGQRNRANIYYLDGANDLGSFNGVYNYEPVLDDIQEFRVQTHSDLAEFGGVTGGIVTIVTRSGTNQYHGTLWDFSRNGSIGTAVGYFSTVPNNLRYNQFGVVFGGPVRIPKVYNGRNRTFFFFAYEGFRQSQTTTSYDTTPTAAQLSGDFSELCTTFNASGICTSGTQLYNPYSTTSTGARTPFPFNNVSSELNTAAVTYAKTIFPAPQPNIIALNLSGGYNVVNNTNVYQNSDNFSGRIDQSFGSRDLLYGRISE